MPTGSGHFEYEAAEAIHSVADRLEKVRPSHIATVELPPVSLTSKPNLVALLKHDLPQSETAIYAISLPDANPAQAHEALTKARNNRLDERCYSRVLPLPEAASATLYVGSSRHLQKRLLEHFGHGPKKTYSLHMLSWAQPLGRIVIDVRFYQSAIEKDLLCALEDHWANTLKPLFGKRGSV